MRKHRLAYLVTLLGALTIAAPVGAQTTATSVTLTWTTPGDDGANGTASQFDLRYSTSAINSANFASATRFNGTPTPSASGSTQGVTVTGLSPATLYYFAIKTGDEKPNWASISNVISKSTLSAPDLVRPARLAINVGALTDSTAALTWTAVGDDSLTGTAQSYDVRYSTSPINDSNWGSATTVGNEPTPSAPGNSQGMTITGLSRQVAYYFAAKVSDDAGNLSALSNVPTATTPDGTPPATIHDLAASFMWISWHSADAVRPALVAVERK